MGKSFTWQVCASASMGCATRCRATCGSRFDADRCSIGQKRSLDNPCKFSSRFLSVSSLFLSIPQTQNHLKLNATLLTMCSIERRYHTIESPIAFFLLAFLSLAFTRRRLSQSCYCCYCCCCPKEADVASWNVYRKSASKTASRPRNDKMIPIEETEQPGAGRLRCSSAVAHKISSSVRDRYRTRPAFSSNLEEIAIDRQ